jgi:hypothetical protein
MFQVTSGSRLKFEGYEDAILKELIQRVHFLSHKWPMIYAPLSPGEKRALIIIGHSPLGQLNPAFRVPPPTLV